MPAMLDDPATPTIYRVSGEPPYPDPSHPSYPANITPRHVTLRDRQTVATVIPFASRDQVPESLLRYLSDQFNKEIEGGDTYPMMDTMPFDKFAAYWFQNFAGIMLLGSIERAEDIVDGKDWSKECLGTFYIKPNYPGRSSHICNAGFIVTDASRNRGVGRLMGETYLEWAPKLGYKYSVFNLVYDTNVASCKIWDALGFKRIGRVKGAGNLKSHPDRLVDAIIFGRDLGDGAGGAGNEELVSEERFDKIKFYLKYGRYPNGADRAEKSRLRSAAMHYKLLDGDVLMLKDKEVISDPQRQYEIARQVHNHSHAGINKSTATIAEHYHWSRIKETVSDVIRNCYECKELGKASSSQAQQPASTGANNGLKRPHPDASAGAPGSKRTSPSPSGTSHLTDTTSPGPPRPQLSSLPDPSRLSPFSLPSHHTFTEPDDGIPLIDSSIAPHQGTINPQTHNPMLDAPHGPLHPPPHHHHHHHGAGSHPPVPLPPLTDPHSVSVSVPVPVSVYQPIDPQIISQPSGTSDPHTHTHAGLHSHHHHHHHYPSFDDHAPPHHHHQHDPVADADTDTFQALLNAGGDDIVDVGVDDGVGAGLGRTQEEDEAERAAVDRDMEMLIEQPQDDEDDVVVPPSLPSLTSVLSPGITTQSSTIPSISVGRDAHQIGEGTLLSPVGINTGGSNTGANTTGNATTTGGGRTSGAGGKMDVSHLLSAHDDDDDHQGKDDKSRDRMMYDVGYDGAAGS
ncbi:hypothetical protein QBC47DRAFT_424493 [Echria macrotheca]|uniref:N-acetyltransferase domain-containing protein n=1 Tax=Echria macrotheca TaxID=438768 RepID=A0AAJ0B8F8_9PEZI|nr:hypothetical protein QBC47DRAFT_424493 [Echria macrotheca]